MGRPYGWIREAPDATAMKTSDRIALWLFIVGLTAFAVMQVTVTLPQVIRIIVSTPLTVSLEVPGYALPGVEAAARATAIDVDLTWVDPGERFWLATEAIASALGFLVLCGCLVYLLFHLSRRVAFPAGAPWVLLLAGFGSLFGQGVAMQAGTFARTAIAERLALDYAMTIDVLRVGVLPIVLIVMAFLLGAGTRLQRDTEGLV